MGITYSMPVYLQEDGRNVFEGVMAVDYTLSNVEKFLQDNFQGSENVLAIWERAEPHYVVASSTEGRTVKVVLVDDESQLCGAGGDTTSARSRANSSRN